MDADTQIRLQSSFPSPLGRDVQSVCNVIGSSEFPPTPGDIGPVQIRGERISIPSRVYFKEPSSLSTLSEIQTTILACLFTRHHDGFTRELYLSRIIPVVEAWVVPFVIQLLGEYVVEIAVAVERRVAELHVPLFSSFVAENPTFCHLTTQRIISYWDCFYRGQYFTVGDYPPSKVARQLGMWTKEVPGHH